MNKHVNTQASVKTKKVVASSVLVTLGLAAIGISVFFGIQKNSQQSANITGGPGSVDRLVLAAQDDAEEYPNGNVVNNSDLEMVWDAIPTANQTVGIRFANMTIPPGATITNAYIQFTADEAQSGAVSLFIQGQAADNPPNFPTGTATFNISSRARTTAQVNWSTIPAWNTIGEAGASQRTPNMSSIVQEIVNRPGWVSGNAIVIVIRGNGAGSASSKRTTNAFEDTDTEARLHVDYQTGPVNTAPSVNAGPDQTIVFPATAALVGTVSDDGQPAGTLTNTWSKVSGPGSVTFAPSANTLNVTATFSLPGLYVVRLTASDGAASSTDDVTINVQAGPPTTLTVSDWSNISRTAEPVTTGIPIPANATEVSWALFDGATEVPLQTTILPGIKTPWVLLDFQTSTTANGTKNLVLKQQTPAAVPAKPVVVSDDSSTLTVQTGLIQTTVSKTAFNILDTAWFDTDNDGLYESSEIVINPTGSSNLFANDAVTGLSFSGRGAPSSMTWEYRGPLRATLRVDGAYTNGLVTLLNYTTRLTWYAGQSYVKIEHLIRNSLAAQERWVKVRSAKLNLGTATTTNRIARSGETVWANRSGGSSIELIPATLEISADYNPYGSPPVQRQQQTLNIDTNGVGGGMIIGDLSYHGATVQLDFAPGLTTAEKNRRTTAAKDPMIALAPEAHYSNLGAFGSDHFGTYTDEKNTYTKLGYTWPTAGNVWSNEHSRPRVQDMYMSWSKTSSEDFEADELWQNIMMLARVRLPYYLDRLRSFARFWNWEWTMRSDGYAFNGSWPAHWYYGNGIARIPAIIPAPPTLTEADTDFINHNVKWAKANNTHVWNGGSVDYYYLTGDQDSLQAAIDMAEQCTMSFANRTPANTGIGGTGSRYTMRCLHILTRTWEATNDPQWKTAADHQLTFFLQSPYYDQRGFFYSQPCALPSPQCTGRENGKSFNGFPTAVAVDALYRYYLLTNNQSVKTQLVQMATFFRDNALDPVTGFGGSNYVIDAPNPGNVFRVTDIYGHRASKDFVNTMVVGYRLTGDRTYLTKAILAWKRGSSSISGTNHATDTQVGRWENSLQAWDPYSALFPEGGDLTYASLLFYHVSRMSLGGGGGGGTGCMEDGKPCPMVTQ